MASNLSVIDYDAAVLSAGFLKQMRVVSSRDPAMDLGRVLLRLSGGRPPPRV